MWKCPKCETINEYEYCSVCGEQKPRMDERRRMEQTNDKMMKVLLVVIAGLVVAALFFLCILPMAKDMMSSDNSSSTKSESRQTAVPTVKPTQTPQYTVPPVKERKILGIYSGRYDGGVDELIIETTDYVVPEMSTLSNPARVVIDFYGFTLENAGYSTGMTGYNFSDVRKANHGSYARVVIDVTKNCHVNLESTENRCVVRLTPR